MPAQNRCARVKASSDEKDEKRLNESVANHSAMNWGESIKWM